MSVQVVVVHDDVAFLTALASQLRQAGYEVAAYSNATAAYDKLKGETRVEVLITRVIFLPNQPHGGVLATVARVHRPALKTIILAMPEIAERISVGNHTFILPVEPDEVVQAVGTLLRPADQQTTPR